jgi:type IV pilus assembly protein PilA
VRKQNGFSLIELLIVVAIILIIAAIAIPNLMRSRITSNNASAAATVRTLNTAEATYSSTYQGSGFGSLAQLGGALPCTGSATTACIVDPALGCAGASCQSGSYNFMITTLTSATDYIIFASPIGATVGDKDYCSTPDMVVRWTADTTATGTTPLADAGCQNAPYSAL